MRKCILIFLMVALSCFTAEAFFETAAKRAASSDQSIIAGRLVERNLINRTFVLSAPLTNFNAKTPTLTLLSGGKVQSRDTIVNRWDIGPNNSLNFYIVDELRANFRYDPSERALVARPFIVGKQAHIRMW